MSEGNYKPAFCEQFHAYILNEFHRYRGGEYKEIDAAEFMKIVGTAKLRLYADRPESEKAGYEILP